MFQGISSEVSATVCGVNFYLFRHYGVFLRLEGQIEANEMEEIKKTNRNFVILSTKLKPMAIPQFLQLSKKVIWKEGFFIEFDKVEEKFWTEQKTASPGPSA
ncbi:MAG: hypothetical protein COX29_02340 [Candidatus Moranbacteria bacterium CG23_combo_of_CG06-09_8_20_14_all_35_22]|nr:MAG: hypothetical protein COX29_02340 [Candidatus Moranbacteria bacterium CG23_combo_of_CG06-09_8_20_14_all_35_22]